MKSVWDGSIAFGLVNIPVSFKKTNEYLKKAEKQSLKRFMK